MIEANDGRRSLGEGRPAGAKRRFGLAANRAITPAAADLDSFAALMADEETARFIGGVAPREVTWRALMTIIGAWHATGVSMFSVFEKATGRWVGRLGPWMPEGWPGAEIRLGHRPRLLGPWLSEAKAQRRRWISRSIVLNGPTSSTPSRRTTARRNRSRASSAHGIVGLGACRRRSRTLPVDIWGQTREEWRAARRGTRRIRRGVSSCNLSREESDVVGCWSLEHPPTACYGAAPLRWRRRHRVCHLRALRDSVSASSKSRLNSLDFAAIVKPLTFHGLRHTCATLLLQARVPVHVVSERLRHATTGMTLEVYAHVLPDMQQEAAATLGALLHGSPLANR